MQRFSEFFTQASDAYYRRAAIGRDFITAVSFGPLFGAVIARFIAAEAARRWGDLPTAVVEFGAAGGHLMSDVISELRRFSSEGSAVNDYGEAAMAPTQQQNLSFYISEPKDILRQQQNSLLGGEITHIDSSFRAPRAVVFANELFDALAFELVISSQLVGVQNGALQPFARYFASDFAPTSELEAFCVQNGEIATGVGAFLAQLCEQFDEFSLLTFDYFCPHSDAISARVFARHLAPISITEADLSMLSQGAADITFSPAIDQIYAYASSLNLHAEHARQASWLIAARAHEIAQQRGWMNALKALCFGLSENFCAFCIRK